MVAWDALPAAPFGYAIDVRTDTGAFRPIAVAPGNATSATLSLFGVPATAVRIRAWNANGTSDPSPEAAIVYGRMRAVR